jgi:CDP-4-dehydro-6-deoxyglucose reductase
LEAALKAGLHLDYGCSSGNCGACKVRILSGKVSRIRDHDFVLSAQEREQGYVLACSNTAVTDVLLEAAEASRPADLPRQEIRCTLRKVESVSAEVTLIRVQTPRTQTLRFMAGQRVTLTTEDGHSRELPVASCPCDARNLQFVVRRRSGDAFSESLLSGPRGQTLLIEGPRGDFLLQEESTEPAVFVAVEDGFAPIKSLIEHAIAIDNVARMQLYRIDAIPPGSQIGNLCRSWHDALDNFGYRRLEAATTPEEAWQHLLWDLPRIDTCELYVAGPSDWVQTFVAAAPGHGAREDRVHADTLE